MLTKKLLRLTIGIAFPVVFMFVLFWALYVKIPLPCIFYRTTGLFCPSCGATRAIIYLASGNLISALKSNIFITVSVIPLLLVFGRIWLGAVLNRDDWMVPDRFALKLLCLLAILYVVFGIVRNLPTTPFIWFNPIN